MPALWGPAGMQRGLCSGPSRRSVGTWRSAGLRHSLAQGQGHGGGFRAPMPGVPGLCCGLARGVQRPPPAPAYLFRAIHPGAPDGCAGLSSLGRWIMGLLHCDKYRPGWGTHPLRAPIVQISCTRSLVQI